jgi:RNA polymerase sigma factor FliA
MRTAARLAEPSQTYSRQRQSTRSEQLIHDHVSVVRRIAWHVSSRMSSSIAIEDMIQIGIVALIEAANSFEDRGIAFAPYASMRIRGAMIDELRKVARMSRAGMANRKLLAAKRAILEAQNCRAANDAEMIAALGVEAPTYFAMVESAVSGAHDSVDEIYSEYDPMFADTAPLASDLVETSQQRTVLAQALSQLAEREALVLQLFFVEELNLHEIGEILGVGAARVCQIKKAALAKAHEFMTANATE